MTIYEGSRYETARAKLVRGLDGLPRTVIEFSPPESLAPFAFTPYTIREGDRIDRLADEFYGDPELWWAIADANPTFLYWDDLPVGLTIRIPSE